MLTGPSPISQARGVPWQAEHHVRRLGVLRNPDGLISYAGPGQAGPWGNEPGADTVRALRSFLYNRMLARLVEEDMKMRPFVSAMAATVSNVIAMRAAG